MDLTDLQTLQALTEDDARDYLERLRWSKGLLRLTSCPVCGSRVRLYPETRRGKHGYYRCSNICFELDANGPLTDGHRAHFVFSVRTGTVLQHSNIHFKGWLVALACVSSSDTPYMRSISGAALGRLIGVTSEPARKLVAKIIALDHLFLGQADDKRQSHADCFLMRHRARCLLRHVDQVIEVPETFEVLWNPEYPASQRHIERLRQLSSH